mgnify:CR=1 FL=1
MQIDKGIYGLPQSGKLAQDDLIPLLAAGGYHQCQNTPLLFKHPTKAISFVLVVDDFLVKYSTLEDVVHLLEVIGQKYKFTVDLTGSKYFGMSVAYDQTKDEITLSVPGYVRTALKTLPSNSKEQADTLYSPIQPPYLREAISSTSRSTTQASYLPQTRPLFGRLLELSSTSRVRLIAPCSPHLISHLSPVQSHGFSLQ